VHVPFQRSATTRRQHSIMTSDKTLAAPGPPAKDITSDSLVEGHNTRRTLRLRNPWACSLYTLVAALLGFAALFLMMQSFTTRQLDTKGCEMSYMRPIFHRFHDFDTEHTRFASKYSLYLYREGGIDEDSKVGCHISPGRTLLIEPRSKAFRYFSFQEMLAVISKFARSGPKQHTTITML
jgi:hypothetical protein